GFQKVPPVELAHFDSSPVGNVRRWSRQPEKPPGRCLGPVGYLPRLASTSLSSAEIIIAFGHALPCAAVLSLPAIHHPGQLNPSIIDRPIRRPLCRVSPKRDL